MIWVDRVAAEIKKRELPLEWVDDMKTPSGRIHVGSLRGVVIHDLIYKALVDQGIDAKSTYVFDDHDPMDGLPSYLDEKEWGKYMGRQLFNIPSPEPGFENFARYYAQDFIEVFNSINCHPEIIWASELYKSGRMNGVIREVLDGVDKIRKIYEKIYEKSLPNDWFPFAPLCEKCENIGSTRAYKWDGENIHYVCEPAMVTWAKGCGHKGVQSPFDGRGKLSWKVEWPAKWKVIGVTVEGAGKDHMSAGGSHDVAKEVCRKVLHTHIPYEFSYEFFIIGGKKMSSSKGLGASAREVSQILPPEVFRFLMVRAPIERTIDFNPYGDTILNLFDDYDKCLTAYYDKLENKLPDGKQGEVMSDFARIMQLSQVRPLPDKRVFVPRFRTVVNLVKNKGDLLTSFEKQKGSALNTEEKEILGEREVYAQVYLKEYAVQVSGQAAPAAFTLSPLQKGFLKKLHDVLDEKMNKDEVQEALFSLLKKEDIKPRDIFPALYHVLIGQTAGPRAADLIVELGVAEVKKKIHASL